MEPNSLSSRAVDSKIFTPNCIAAREDLTEGLKTQLRPLTSDLESAGGDGCLLRN